MHFNWRNFRERNFGEFRDFHLFSQNYVMVIKWSEVLWSEDLFMISLEVKIII